MEYEYYRNKNVIEGKRLQLARLVPKIQQAVDAWLLLQVGSIETLPELIFNPDALLLNSVKNIIPNPKRVGGFAVSKDSLLQTLELPALDLVKMHTNGIQVYLKSNNVSLEFFAVENNEVKISKYFENVIAENTNYCRNESEKELVMLTERILEAVTELNSLLTSTGATHNEANKILTGQMQRMFISVGSDYFVSPSFISQYSHLKLNGKVKNESEKH